MFETLQRLSRRPEVFSCYTADMLWTEPHLAKQMLAYHLDGKSVFASRPWDFIDRSVEWIVSHFGLGSGSRVCDFGCGPGLYTTRLARCGAEVTGIDFSQGSIDHAVETAEREGLAIEYRCHNYLEFRTEKRFDLITMIYCDLCALSPAQRQTLFGIFRDHLNEGGSVLLDVFSKARFDGIKEERVLNHMPNGGFWSPDAHHEIVHTFKYDPEMVTLDRCTIIEQSRTREIYNWLQHFTVESLTRELADNGFDVMEHYSSVAGDPWTDDATEIAVVARPRV